MKNLDEIFKSVGSTADFLFSDVTDVNQSNGFGDTPLHIVCRWADLDAVKILLQAGANINAKGEFKMTPIFSAIDGGSVDIIKLLIDSGADCFVEAEGPFEGWTPLKLAETKKVNSEIINLLKN